MSWSQSALAEIAKLQICKYKVMAAATAAIKSYTGGNEHRHVTINVDGAKFQVYWNSYTCPTISLAS